MLNSTLQIKKIGRLSIFLRIKAIVNSLLAVGDSITKQDQIDSILDGLFEKYNTFFMQMYEGSESHSLCDVEDLLYVQEAQLDQFCQELSVSTVIANLACTSQSQEYGSSKGAYSGNCGRGNRFPRGRSHGRGRYTIANHPTYQLCGKYGHSTTIVERLS